MGSRLLLKKLLSFLQGSPSFASLFTVSHCIWSVLLQSQHLSMQLSLLARSGDIDPTSNLRSSAAAVSSRVRVSGIIIADSDRRFSCSKHQSIASVSVPPSQPASASVAYCVLDVVRISSLLLQAVELTLLLGHLVCIQAYLFAQPADAACLDTQLLFGLSHLVL